MASASEGERSILVVNQGNQSQILEWLDSISGVDSMNLKIVPAKENALAAAEEGLEHYRHVPCIRLVHHRCWTY